MCSLSRMFRYLTGVLCLGFLAASPMALGADAAWTATATRGVGTVLTNATDLGPLAPDTSVHLVVALALQNQSDPQQLIQEENTPGDAFYDTVIMPNQFAASYAPTSSQVQAVTSYLSTAGMTNIQVEPNDLFVTADTTAAQANAAFNTIWNSRNWNSASRPA